VYIVDMASNEPIFVSLWRYIRQILFGGTPPTITNSHPHAALSGLEHKVLIPGKLISNLEYLYDHGGITPDKLARYQADVNYFLGILDDYSGDDLGQFISEINELDALINLAAGNQSQAESDIRYALSLNPDGTWLVSNAARNWKKKSEGINTSPNTSSETIKHVEHVTEFHNTWTEDIKGWGYSPNSRFNKLRHQVFSRDNFKCSWCGSRINLTVDHIKERHLGGTNELNNLRTLCKDCHEKRHGRKIFDKEFNVDDDYGFANKATTKMAALVKAADTGEGLCIEYEDRDGLRSLRVIHPLRIYKSRYIFINAYCELDKEERVFRLTRMRLSAKRDNRYLNKTNSYTSRAWSGPNPFNTNAGRTIYSRPASSKLKMS
jgi:5-methylcytosine-specific restriction enzyme A